MKVLSSASFFAFYTIKYYAFYFNIKSVKELMMQLQCVHNKLKDKNEITIIKKYDCLAQRFTTIITTLGICGICSSITMQLWMNIDVNTSTNVSRSFNFLITTEYFIDQNKYFYLIFLHINAAICVGTISIVAVGTINIAYVQHICGMFRIASYRIEYAINIRILHHVSLRDKIWMAKGVIYAVNIHRQAMILAKHFISTFQKMFACLIVCGVASCSLNLFQLSSFQNDVQKFLFSFTISFMIIIYMFLTNLMGQKIIDHNNHVLITAYNVKWYKTPVHIQRMILFLLQIGAKEFTLNIGGLIHGSMEGFAMLMKATISYFTVIHSIR
ncbi:uncharacterized protein LOC120359127 [Solenopsis invicta]|uniref:uncharacterized protein LOC120359127 n=1 Tax=Solenopsis invicta TaxID=13686 RepID=UPI00193DAAB4|nr:uncharacterized protein LOC120359127 [Solenopsis invicta]